jgi:hypothetical protein
VSPLPEHDPRITDDDIIGYAHEIFGFRTHKPEVNIVVVRDVEEMKGEKPSPQLK